MLVAIDLFILLVLLVIGVPVPFCFMAAVLFMMIVTGGFSPIFLISTGFNQINSLAVLCVLFFILMGGIMSSTGIAARLVAISDSLLGRTKSGLGTVSVISTAIFGAIAGTCTAAVAAIGSIMIPRMVDRGYPRGHATALISASSVEGQLIPPSVPMILYAWVTWQSVAACFLSTVVPGLIMVFLYSFVNWFMIRKLPIKTLPPTTLANQAKEFGTSVYNGFWALLMPIIVLGGIYGGVFTPTEAAGIASVYCIVVGFFIYRTLSVKMFLQSLINSVTTTGVIVLMVFFVMMLSKLYVMENVPQRLVDSLFGLTDNIYLIMLLVNLFLLLLGMLMDDFSGTILAAALLFPVMTEIGIHPIHFAAILGTNLGLGNKTPPTAPILYLAARIGNCPLDKLIKPQFIFICTCSLPVMLVTTFFPPLSLTLPHLIMPKAVPYVPLFIGG
ncbi:MAG: TRAP transporter large permease [Desulfohalobiaceae bacterium]|nr:TRAP transporter large permease [Desulfohalobiaceae bacterium]